MRLDEVRELKAGLAELLGNQDFLSRVGAITEAREQSYGSARRHFTKTVGLINTLYDLDLTPEDWAVFMVCDKLARESETPDEDNLLDIAGYASRRYELLADQVD